MISPALEKTAEGGDSPPLAHCSPMQQQLELQWMILLSTGLRAQRVRVLIDQLGSEWSDTGLADCLQHLKGSATQLARRAAVELVTAGRFNTMVKRLSANEEVAEMMQEDIGELTSSPAQMISLAQRMAEDGTIRVENARRWRWAWSQVLNALRTLDQVPPKHRNAEWKHVLRLAKTRNRQFLREAGTVRHRAVRYLRIGVQWLIKMLMSAVFR